MPDLDDLLIGLSNEILPSLIQFTFLLMATIGVTMIAANLVWMYQMLRDERGMTSTGLTAGKAMWRMFFAALLVTPSVTLWRTADAFLQGGDVTESKVLAYITDGVDTSAAYCNQFSDAVTLAFIFVGVIGIYVAYQAIDDYWSGFRRDGIRVGIVFFAGSIGCIFINDVALAIGNTVGYDLGFEAVCSNLAGGEG